MLLEMNPVIFTIGKFSLKWYSLFILIAFITVYYVFKKEAWRFRVPQDFIFNLGFWTFILGIIGARIWYVIFNFSYYSENLVDIFKIWEGGLAIHGGMIAGALVVFVYCKKYKFRFIRLLDFILPAFLLGQAIGRWGNFFNGEAHGFAVSAATLKSYLVPNFIVNGMTIGGVTYVPTFLIESISCLVLFIILVVIRRYRYIKVGSVSALYLMGYGVIRFFVEFQRVDALLINDVRVAQVLSVVLFIIGLTILINNMRKGKLDDLYNDKENVPNIKY